MTYSASAGIGVGASTASRASTIGRGVSPGVDQFATGEEVGQSRLAHTISGRTYPSSPATVASGFQAAACRLSRPSTGPG
jgi:hypothetical protein